MTVIAENTAFKDWMAEVNNLVSSRIGLDVDDLEDYRWRDAFDAGATPAEAVQDWIDESDDPMLIELFDDLD